MFFGSPFLGLPFWVSLFAASLSTHMSADLYLNEVSLRIDKSTESVNFHFYSVLSRFLIVQGRPRVEIRFSLVQRVESRYSLVQRVEISYALVQRVKISYALVQRVKISSP